MNAEPRDFIETLDGLIFAVLDRRLEADRVLCFLRYRREHGKLIKLDTRAANAWLARHAPDHLFRSTRLAADLHGVRVKDIRHHYRPRERVAALRLSVARDAIEAKAQRCLAILEAGGLPSDQIGLTGSLLVGAQHPASDLDFVLYERAAFHRARAIIREAIAAGDLSALTKADWRDAYDRRACALSLDEYIWHELRKHHKGLCDGAKFDLTLVAADAMAEPADPVRKLGRIRIKAAVQDATHAFDFPARYRLNESSIHEVLSFTHTYAGQALAGEWVEIAGHLESTAGGQCRIVVGSSREAPGEFIKVTSPPSPAPAV